MRGDEKAKGKQISMYGKHDVWWCDSMVVPGATWYYIIDRSTSSVPISCRNIRRSPGTTGLHANIVV